MAFREVPVFEVREVLRLWIGGEGFRSIDRLTRVDRKTVRRYVEAAVAVGVTRDGGQGQLSDEMLGAVIVAARPVRPDGHGEGWAALADRRERLVGWLDSDVPVVKIGELLGREGVVVPERTLHRFVADELGRGRGQGVTVRVNDGEPGVELQVDFAKLGLVPDEQSGRQRVVHALIFTAVFSRHMFVWLTHTQTTGDVIAGCEAAWRFFGGVFKVLIPDNLTPVVTKADKTEPRFNQAFLEYAQGRGFLIDPARVRTPTDKPRVERMVQFVRSSFWAGETFAGLADAQARVEVWCAERAGMRVHGTTQCRPVEHFLTMEAPMLLSAPTSVYDLPVYASCKVHRDHHLEIAKALYSVPGNLIGTVVEGARRLEAREGLRPWATREDPPTPTPGRAVDRPGGSAIGPVGLRVKGSRSSPTSRRASRPAHRPLRRRGARSSVAVDEDAPGLRAARSREEMGTRPCRRRLQTRPRRRSKQREPDRAHAGTRHRERPGHAATGRITRDDTFRS